MEANVGCAISAATTAMEIAVQNMFVPASLNSSRERSSVIEAAMFHADNSTNAIHWKAGVPG